MSGEIINIGIEHIHPHPDNPRKDLGDLSELAESIKKNGIMQNLTVAPSCRQGEYTAIIGHRRCAAARLAGITELPCRVIEGMSEKEQLTAMLEENMQRNDLTVYEQAQGFQLMLDLGETEDTLAEKTGFSKTTIRHRLNIAKLDQEELKKKTGDEGYQLTLKDLYALEEIKDIKKRNKVLKEATDSKNLIWLAHAAAEKEKMDKNAEAVINILKKRGVREAPENAGREIYSNKWDVMKKISLDKDVPHSLKLPQADGLFYLQHYREIKVIRKAKRIKRELSQEELERKQRDRNKKEIKAKMSEMDVWRKEFISSIISGRVSPVKDEGEIKDRIWGVIMEIGEYISASGLQKFLTGKNSYECNKEEKETAQKKMKGLSCLYQMLIMLHNLMETAGDIYDYQGHYTDVTGEKLARGYGILKEYGFSFRSDEDVQILNGTHPLYTKEEG